MDYKLYISQAILNKHVSKLVVFNMFFYPEAAVETRAAALPHIL
jgi:hypothetical protein